MNLFGLIGYPLSHSFSPHYFNTKFKELGLRDYEYKAFPLEKIEDLKFVLKTEKFLKGFNITIPYKQKILPFLNHAVESVLQIGACNCVSIKNGQLIGYNTDAIGFEMSLKPLLKNKHTKALILGYGGAAKAVEYVLTKNNIEWKYVSRQQHSENYFLTYDQINQTIIEEYTLIINTTPLGMSPHIQAAPQLPYQYIHHQHLCYDLIYNPEKTLFLKECEKQGASIKNGYELLLLQAEESWKIWEENSS